MRRLQDGKEQLCLLDEPAFPDKGGLLKTGFFSLLFHIALILFLTINLRPAIPKGGLSVYRVTLRPFLPHGNGTPLGNPILSIPGPSGGLSTSIPSEKPKPVENAKAKKSEKEEVPQTTKKQKSYEQLARDKIAAGIKTPQKKGEKVERGKDSFKSLHEAIEEIHKKAALEEIQRRVAHREKVEKEPTEGQSTSHLSQGPIASGAGTGVGLGTGSGSVGSPTGGSLWGSSLQGSSISESKLNDYYSMIWAKIKKEWTLPENLPQGKINLETIIVVIIEREGKIQKSWFEKRSGNTLYDQMAMRAIKKAEPLPPIPKEFSDDTFEIGIRFHPD